MRNASYVTACYSHSCGQKIVCVERYERMHIEMTAEHIKATSVSIAALSKHVDVPRRQRGNDEKLLKVINKKTIINKKELNNSRNTMTVFIQNKKNEIMLFKKEVYQKPQISVFAVDVEALMENASGNAGTLEGSVPVGDAKRAIEWDDMDDEEDWEAESFQ